MADTNRVEIKPDIKEETLEQSAEKLKNDGIDVSKDNAKLFSLYLRLPEGYDLRVKRYR